MEIISNLKKYRNFYIAGGAVLLLFILIALASWGYNSISDYFIDKAIGQKKAEVEQLNKDAANKRAEIASLDGEEKAKRAAVAEVEKQRLGAIAEFDKAVKDRDSVIAGTNKLIEDLKSIKGKKGVTAADVECALLGKCK